jgi:Helix-turn-helix domain
MQNPVPISLPQIEPFVNASEAGSFVKLHPATVLRLAREGALPGHPVGNGARKRWRFLLSELQTWLTSRSSDEF